VNSSGVATQEPISSELVLVDEELALRARGALPDPPWLLPFLAELEEAAKAEPPVADEVRPAPAAVPEPAPRPSRARIPAAAVVVFLLFALAPLAFLVYSLLPAPKGPSLAAEPEQPPTPTAATSTPTNTASPDEPSSTGSDVKPKPAQKSETTKPKARTKPRALSPVPKRTAKPKPTPRALAKAQRVFSWRRYPGAVYYQLYLQQGAKTIYQARTVKPTAVLPASLRVLPGTYKVFVRPAVPSDAGIILGATILGKTVTV
jgi:hypothetical protein